jgi:large subunit ribosomal protein L9
MELILLEKVQNLGDLGDQVSVKPGYGRNYLVPNGIAVRATEENVARFEARRAELEAAAAEKLGAASGRAAQFEGIEIVMTANASEEGKLYGSIGPREIADKLVEMGHEVNKSEVVMGEGVLRNTGEYVISLKLHADIETELKVFVNPE